MPGGIELSVELEGEKQLSRRLLIVADGVTDFTDPLNKIGGELKKTFDDNFDDEGSLFGGWRERKPQYRDGIRIDTWPLLQKTGEMRQSFESIVDKNSLTISNKAPYFVYHQSNKPRYKLPRRVMMKVDEERRQYIQKAFQAYLVSLMRSRR